MGAASTISTLIKILLDSMVKHEKWPDECKIQMVRPIYKQGKKSDIINYRPISLLPVIDKVMEKLFVNKINDFLEYNKVINKMQFGFMKNKSTTDALCELNDAISGALDQGKYVGIIFVDLQKAFDSVNHSKLIEKCSSSGLRGKMGNI